jgi:hypothetical protein
VVSPKPQGDRRARDLEREAEVVVALAFRHGPVHALHAGRRCPTCADDPSYSKITSEQVKVITNTAVDRVYWLLLLRDADPDAYSAAVERGAGYTYGPAQPSEKSRADVPSSCQRGAART